MRSLSMIRGGGGGGVVVSILAPPAVSTGKPDVADLLVTPKKERVVCLQSWGVGVGGRADSFLCV